MKLLIENPDKINWNYLSSNSNEEAIKLLIENRSKIYWYGLSLNSNEEALKLLNKNLDKIYWYQLCLNVNKDALELLKQNPDKINWDFLSKNPEIFIYYDYKKIKKEFQELGEEIIIKSLHPKRMLRLMEEYGEDYIYDCYLDD